MMRMASAVVKGRGSSPYKDIAFQLLKKHGRGQTKQACQGIQRRDASVPPLGLMLSPALALHDPAPGPPPGPPVPETSSLE